MKLKNTQIKSIVLVLIMSTTSLFAQDFKTVKGIVKSAESKQVLEFASIQLMGTELKTISNTEGTFEIKVPLSVKNAQLRISFLGYADRVFSVDQFDTKEKVIELFSQVTELEGVELERLTDLKNLIQTSLERKESYVQDAQRLTTFYRETIKKGNKNAALAEAVNYVYKAPYQNSQLDRISLIKSRKQTDYSRLDTVALKLQGGPFNALFIDLVKYPRYIFEGDLIDAYNYTLVEQNYQDQDLIYTIAFEPIQVNREYMYKGTLKINASKVQLLQASYALNIIDPDRAAQLFVRKKPSNLRVWPKQVNYFVNYGLYKQKGIYNYSNVNMSFAVNYKRKIFNKNFTLKAEMATTDIKPIESTKIEKDNRFKTSIILVDQAEGFSDPDFWGAFNIIEPEKSIEVAIRKIQRKLRQLN